MKKSLVYLIALMFLLATAVSFAGDTKKPTSSDKTTEDPHAKCPMMKKASAEAEVTAAAGEPAATIESKPAAEQTGAVKEAAPEATPAATTESAAPKVAESCPDVTGRAALSSFHEVMSPMHMAFEENKYDEMKSSMPKLIEASKGIASSKCPSSDKCPPDCIKKFDEKKAALLKGVEELDLAFKGDDTKKVDAAFMTMHQAFVDFASVCNLAAKEADTKATDVKVIESKTMEAKPAETETK